MPELTSHVIMKVVTKWHSLGIQLGLQPELLNSIERNYSKDSQRCCVEMFKEWLVNSELEPSWSSLIEALKSDFVSRRDMACELERCGQ